MAVRKAAKRVYKRVRAASMDKLLQLQMLQQMQKKPIPWKAIGGVLLVAGGIGAWLWWRSNKGKLGSIVAQATEKVLGITIGKSIAGKVISGQAEKFKKAIIDRAGEAAWVEIKTEVDEKFESTSPTFHKVWSAFTGWDAL